MKRGTRTWIAVGALLLAAAAAGPAFAAAEGAFAPAAEFEKAKQAYDAGKMDESIRLYEEIAGRGYRSPELSFNLGNAYFRQGKTALAVLQYRSAWRQAPRDPDIAANLQFALQTAGAPPPGTPLWDEYKEQLVCADPYAFYDCMHTLLPTRMPLNKFYRAFSLLYLMGFRYNPWRARHVRAPLRDLVRLLVSGARCGRALRTIYKDYDRSRW